MLHEGRILHTTELVLLSQSLFHIDRDYKLGPKKDYST